MQEGFEVERLREENNHLRERFQEVQHRYEDARRELENHEFNEREAKEKSKAEVHRLRQKLSDADEKVAELREERNSYQRRAEKLERQIQQEDDRRN